MQGSCLLVKETRLYQRQLTEFLISTKQFAPIRLPLRLQLGTIILETSVSWFDPFLSVSGRKLHPF